MISVIEVFATFHFPVFPAIGLSILIFLVFKFIIKILMCMLYGLSQAKSVKVQMNKVITAGVSFEKSQFLLIIARVLMIPK